MIYTIKENVSSEVTVKKSKFIGNIFYAETEEEAQEIINRINKKYHDAKHNCYAYVIEEVDDNGTKTIEKSSDNGEPSGTAGAPLLDVLKKHHITNCVIVVTRYFGGILLGTGGLVKAYTEAATTAMEKAKIIETEIGNQYEIEIEYSEQKNFNYHCEQLQLAQINSKYENNIGITINATKEKFKKLQEKVRIINYKLVKNNIWI